MLDLHALPSSYQGASRFFGRRVELFFTGRSRRGQGHRRAAVTELAETQLRTPDKPSIFVLHPSDLLTDHRLHGDGLIACDFLRELAARGYRLHVACRDVDIARPFPNNLTLYRVKQSGRAGLAGRIEYMVRSRFLLNKLRREGTIDLVHQMNPVFAGLSLSVVGSGLPVLLGTYVARWPDMGSGPIRLGAARLVRRAICYLQQRQAAAIMLTTPAALDRIASPRGVKHKIIPMNHGVDAALFAPSSGPPTRGPASILFYTSVTRRKGIFTLLEAFKRVAQVVPDATLSIVGKGEEWDEVRGIVGSMECRDRIQMHGFLPRAQAPELYREHAVYCLPSHGEPLGTTALEAMACGRPLVVTNTGGLPYLLDDNGGLKVPEGDKDALAEALIKLVTSPELQERMGRANRARIQNEFTVEKVVDKLEEVYARILSGKTDEPRRAS
jgi:glycosyltransferase involved in cell wall biosynthesis